MHRGHSKRRWAKLALLLGVVLALAIATHMVSPILPGTAGAIFRQNVEKRIEATALVYTETGDVRDYVDTECGKYR